MITVPYAKFQNCFLFMITVLECAKHFSKQGGDDKIVKVRNWVGLLILKIIIAFLYYFFFQFECYIEGSFEPSGGTLETAISIFNER